VPSAANARHYARIIADKARLRRLVHAAGTAIYDAFIADAATTEGGSAGGTASAAPAASPKEGKTPVEQPAK